MMARPATGMSSIEAARRQLLEAKTVEELRSAQAVILPLEFGLSMEQTAAAIGISTGWACRLRRRFIKGVEQPEAVSMAPARAGGGQGRAYLKREEEQDFLLPFVEKASQAGILIVSEIRQALDKKLKRNTAIGTTYNLLHRHGWRKLSPDTRHQKSQPEMLEDWKKNFLNAYKRSKLHGKEPG
jgi:transposase